jgi:hypothetical protein
MAIAPNQLARDLRELITALDRRVPRVERAGEVSIAQDAAALREKAVQRLRDLQGAEPPPLAVKGRSKSDAR